MAENNKTEDIKIENTLSVLAYPTGKLPDYSNYLLGRYNFWHNGIHIKSETAVKSVYDAQIVAYRLIKNYKHRNFDIDNAKFPSNYFSQIWESTKYKDINKLFTKDEYGFYKLKENPTEQEKEKAYKFINKLYSNSFMLLRHEINNCNNKQITFYSLYNHLKPFSRMTVEQKLNLFFYYSKAEITINKIPYSAYCKFFDISQQKDVLLPAELPLSKDDNTKAYIKWEINKNTYEALIDPKLIRSLKDHYEIKRPGNDKNTNLTNKSDYVSSKSVLVLFDSKNKADRLAKHYLYFQVYDVRDKILEIQSTDLVSWFDDKDDVGLRVRYNNEYLFMYPTNKKEIKEAYKLLNLMEIHKNRDLKVPVSIFCSIEHGIIMKIFFYNGKDRFYFKAPKTHTVVTVKYESNYIQLQKVDLIGDKSRNTVISPYNIIPCETKVKVTSNYTAKFDGKEYHGFIESQYVDNNQMKIKKAHMHEGGGLKWIWKNDCMLVYDAGDIEKRKVIDTIKNNGVLELSDKKELLRFKTNSAGKENELFPQFEKGINVNYKKHVQDAHINSQFNGFIYLSFQNNSGMDYEIEKNKKDFILNMSKWLLSVDEEGRDLVTKNFSVVTVSLNKDKEYKIDDKINYPVKKNVKKGDVIGYTGYSIADENDKTRNSNEDATTMHFEIFTSDTQFMDFKGFKNKDDIEEIKLPCYCKINSECTVYQGKIITICDSSLNNVEKPLGDTILVKGNKKNLPASELFETFSKYENICYEEIERGFLTEGQYYSLIKPVARIIYMNDNEYFRRSEIEWDNNYYYVKGNKEVQVYNGKNEPVEGRKIQLYKDFPYLEPTHYSSYEESIKSDKTISIISPGAFNLPNNDKSLNEKDFYLRRPEFYLDKITTTTDSVYIKTSDLDSYEYRDKSDKDDSKRFYFFYNDKKLEKDKITSKPSSTHWDTEDQEYDVITLKNDDNKKYKFCYEFMHEYNSLNKKHKAQKTWCKIKSDSGTEYWVNKEDFDFTSKDGSKIGLVYYDNWKDFFYEIEPKNYGEFKCDDGKKESFINDYNFNELGIKKVEEIPASSKRIRKFFYQAESEWSDNQKITDEYVNLSPIQKKETTEYRKDLAFFTDEFIRKLSALKLRKKNYYYNPVAFLNHMDKVATPAEFNPYENNTDNLPTICSPVTYCDGKDNPGFAPISLTKTNYEANGVYYAKITGHFNDDYGSYYHEGTDFSGAVGTPVHSFISGKVMMMKNQGTKHYGLSVLIKKDEKEDGKNIYYLLGHLSEYAPQLTINSQVYPGMVVGKVGNTGNCRTNGHALTPQERGQGLGSHLHLSLYKTESRYTALYNDKEDNFITKGGILYNPFDHKEGRKYK